MSVLEVTRMPIWSRPVSRRRNAVEAAAASKALSERPCDRRRLSEPETAEGILRIALDSMPNAVKAVTRERLWAATIGRMALRRTKRRLQP
jgi:hypothetical protein